MRTVYIDEAHCDALPRTPMLVEVGGLMRELILAALEEPLDYDEAGRGGRIAHMILAELARMQERKLDVPMPRDERAAKVARALLKDPDTDLGLDDWAQRSGASRRTLARLFRAQTGFSFAEWRARLRAIDGLARLVERIVGRQRRRLGRLCQPERLHRDGAANVRQAAEPDDARVRDNTRSVLAVFGLRMLAARLRDAAQSRRRHCPDRPRPPCHPETECRPAACRD